MTRGGAPAQDTTNTSCLLTAEHLARSMGGKVVLRDVSLEIGPGEVVGIEGENGSGKTTLLRVLVGLLKAERGTCRRFCSIGYCPQEVALFEALTVRENFYYFAQAYGLPRMLSPDALDQRIEHLLRFFRFEEFAEQQVRALSGGSRQKLNLCLALLHQPRLLILDEPYSAFDWETYLRFWEYVRQEQARGASILFVSHLIFETSQVSRRYLLKNGVLEWLSGD